MCSISTFEIKEQCTGITFSLHHSCGCSEETVLSQEKSEKKLASMKRKYTANCWCGPTVLQFSSDPTNIYPSFPSSFLSEGAVFAQQRDMQYLQRMKSKWMLKTGMSNNATKQKYFRPQVRFWVPRRAACNWFWKEGFNGFWLVGCVIKMDLVPNKWWYVCWCAALSMRRCLAGSLSLPLKWWLA